MGFMFITYRGRLAKERYFTALVKSLSWSCVATCTVRRKWTAMLRDCEYHNNSWSTLLQMTGHSAKTVKV